MSMFCYQCEQTTSGKGCTRVGVCGKDEVTSDLQDLLIYVTKAISMYAHRARSLGAVDSAIDVFVMDALFSTVTNVNFDADRIEGLVRQAYDVLASAKTLYEKACADQGVEPETIAVLEDWQAPTTREAMRREAQAVGLGHWIEQLGPDVAGLQELITYGLKGTAAYADHAYAAVPLRP